MRSRTGMTSLEIALVVCTAIVLLGLTADLLIVIWGYALNDTAARDAARAAASTGDQQSGYSAALAAINVHRGDGYLVTNPQCDTTAHPLDFVYMPQPPDASPPYVTVTTRCRVNAPFSPTGFGAQFALGGIDFARSYTFPILGGSVSTASQSKLAPAPFFKKRIIPKPPSGG